MTERREIESVLNQAALAERLEFEAYGIGERHGAPFLSPPVLLAAIAARTSRIRLLTTVTVLSVWSA